MPKRLLLRDSFRGFDLADADEDHGAEFETLASLHGEDVDLGLPRIVDPHGGPVRHVKGVMALRFKEELNEWRFLSEKGVIMRPYRPPCRFL